MANSARAVLASFSVKNISLKVVMANATMKRRSCHFCDSPKAFRHIIKHEGQLIVWYSACPDCYTKWRNQKVNYCKNCKWYALSMHLCSLKNLRKRAFDKCDSFLNRGGDTLAEREKACEVKSSGVSPDGLL